MSIIFHEVLQTREKGIVTTEDLVFLLSKIQLNSNSKREFDFEEIKAKGLKVFIEEIEGEILKLALSKNEDKVRKTLSDLKISNNSYYRILEKIKIQENQHA